jgi:hypothetical protein
MTRSTNARIAGATFLLYIATGITALVIGSPISGADIAARLAAIATEPWRVRTTILLSFPMFAYAIALGVTLHALTRDREPDLALGGLVFRAAEGIIGMTLTAATVALLWLATSTTAASLDPAGVRATAAALTRIERSSTILSAFAFAVGSLCFCVAFLRARSIPRWLAWLGVIASVLLVVALPLQLAIGIGVIAANVIWLPMLVFELVLGVRLLVKGELAVAP